MLKLSVRAGEYVLIGDDIKLVFTGGSSNNMRILIDAPKSYNIVRSEALERYGMAADPGNQVKHHREKQISKEAQEKIKAILMAERKRIRQKFVSDGYPSRHRFKKLCRDIIADFDNNIELLDIKKPRMAARSERIRILAAPRLFTSSIFKEV